MEPSNSFTSLHLPQPALTPSESLVRPLSLRMVGVGGAGGRIVDSLYQAGLPHFELMAVDTDARDLQRISLPRKVLMGSKLTRGLGAGGDVELGWAGAEKETAELARLCAGADIVFVVAGLGGGTGGGAGAVLARVARESGALVLAWAMQPFDCEGKQRQRQAQRGLQQLRDSADGVVCLPNQRLAQLVDEQASLVEAFRFSHDYLAESFRALQRMLTQPGLIPVDFAHICAALRQARQENVMALVRLSGPEAAAQIADQALRHPLLGGESILAEADTVLASLVAGPRLNLAQVEQITGRLSERLPQAQLLAGASIEPSWNDQFELLLLVGHGADPSPPPSAGSLRLSREKLPEDAAVPENQWLGLPETTRPPVRYLPPPPELSPEQKKRLLDKQSSALDRIANVFPKMRQGQLPLEIVSKGRFEKSEPTIHQGEDLDVPTFMRRGVQLN